MGALGRSLDELFYTDIHQDVIDELLRFSISYIRRKPGLLRKEDSKNSKWYLPEFVDDEIADTVERSLLAELERLFNRNHSLRRQINKKIRSLISELEQGQFQVEKLTQWWAVFTTSKHVERLIDSFLSAVKTELSKSDEADISRIEVYSASFLEEMGQEIASNGEIQHKLDAWLSELAGNVFPVVWTWRAA